MKRRCYLFLPAIFVLLLCACQAEPSPENTPIQSNMAEKTPEQVLKAQLIDDTHDAFLVDTGGTLGTLLITLEQGAPAEDDSGGFATIFFVWSPARMEKPIQTFEKNILTFGYSDVVDANFDGFQDFGYMYMIGNQPSYWYFWLWDEAQGKFVECEALSEISSPSFDDKKQVVTGWLRDSAVSGIETYYRWIDGALALLRRIQFHYPSEEGTQLTTVEDLMDGQMVEVYRKENIFSEINEGDSRIDERWFDLDYHGESSVPG